MHWAWPNLGGVASLEQDSQSFIQLFAGVYTAFCRQLPKRTPLTPESLAVLQHFHLAGPLTITEAARHLDRAQSVLSEMIERLESKALLCRLRDERDRRRVLVWLTPLGKRTLEEEQQVLSPERVQAALARMPDDHRAALLQFLSELIRTTLK